MRSAPDLQPELIDRRLERRSARHFLRERRIGDRMRSLGLVLRWGTTLLGIAILTLNSASISLNVIIVIALMTGVAMWRTLRPENAPSASGAVRTTGEFALLTGAVVATGSWNSPFAFVPIATMLTVGLLWGWTGTAIATAGTAVSITAGALFFDRSGMTWLLCSQVTLLMALSGGCGTYVRRLIIDNNARFAQSRNDQLRLAAANDLLSSLHGVATSLTAPLDLVEVVAAARERCQQFRADAVTMIVIDESGLTWRTEFADGVRVAATHAYIDLPPLVAAAISATDPIVEQDLAQAQSRGWSPMSCAAMAVALRSRRTVVGVLCLEYNETGRMSDDDISYLSGLATNLGLSIDNAMWFARLRTLGAEAERNRLARDLHDRLAQSLAYVAIELERYDKAHGGDPQLAVIYGTVRGIVAELRSTLYELRAAPDDHRSLADLAREYVARFTERTGIVVTLRVGDELSRYPRAVETELWRILQESLTNVERHAQAGRAWVTISEERHRAIVEVRDNGCGFRAAAAGTDRYGIVGMRERADAINAHLTIDSEPGAGTRVRVEVEVPT